jgi:hypothetical protein
MADEDDDKDKGGGVAATWPAFLSELTKNFLILRDIFGYVLPGLIFLVIGLIWKSPFLDQVRLRVEDFDFPIWLQVLVGLVICYTIGHVMAAIAYFRYNKWVRKYEHPRKALFAKQKLSEEITYFARLVQVRGRHPELVIEYERQSTMTQLRGTTGTAMIVGFFIFCAHWPPWLIDVSAWMVLFAGVLLAATFAFSAIPHIDDLGTATLAAAEMCDGKEVEAETRAYDVVVMKKGEVTEKVVMTLRETPGFTISAANDEITVQRGGVSQNVVLTVSPVEDFRAPIELACSGAPEEVEVGLSHNKLGEAGGTVTFSAKAKIEAKPGNYLVTVTAKGANLEHTVAVTIVVDP